MSVERLRRKFSSTGPSMIAIYGPPGTGKTTGAMSFPDAVLIPVEEGLPKSWPDGTQFEVDAFEQPMTYEEFIGFVNTVAESDEFKTLVIDSLDKLEPMIWRYVCQAQNPPWTSIEDPGYGKGYQAAAEEWAALVQMLRDLVKFKSMNVVLIAHSDPVTFSPPGLEPYSRYQMRLNKKAAAIVQDECDIVGFINYHVTIKETKGSFGKTNKHAEGGGTRILALEDRPAFIAKNRHGMPAEIIMPHKAMVYPVIQQYL